VDIFSAVEWKNLRELKRILKSDPLAARRTDCWGRTALMLLSDARASDADG
jgi:hypothetical protein